MNIIYLNWLKKAAIGVLFICNLNNVTAQGFLKAQGKYIVDSSGKKVLLKGMGLGGYMLQEGYMMKVPFSGQQYKLEEKIEDLIGKEKKDEFYEKWLSNHMTKRDVDSLKSWGFNSIRLPMHYKLFTLPVEKEPVKGVDTWLPKGFALTDSLLKWCKQNKMYLILDMHATPGGQGHDVSISDRDTSKPSLWESPENQRKLTALWRKLAERYANEELIGGYDIINEPNWGFEDPEDKSGAKEELNKPLRDLMISITEAIRSVDQNHLIIIEGNGWGNNYNGIFPLWDKNMAVSFHKYWTYNTTESIKDFLQIRETYNVPLWMGESGENSNVWFRDAIKLAQANEIGWCWWPLKKIGFNNPLEVKQPAGYQNLLNYWSGNGKKPSLEQALKTLSALAESIKIENCIYHKDVIDAMFRQTNSNAAIPFKNNIVEPGTILKAVNYDMGEQGTAYVDSGSANYHISIGKNRTLWNNGRCYRNDGVDIEQILVSGMEEYFIKDFEAGEWVQYTIDVKKDGKYRLGLKLKNDDQKLAACEIILNNTKLCSIEAIPAKSIWSQLNSKKFLLKKGKQVLRIKVAKGQLKLSEIVFASAG